MKTILIVAAVFATQLQLSFAQEPSKSDIVATIQHIQRLSREQRNELAKAQSDYQQQGAALQEQKIISQKWEKEAHDNAKQRDVVLIAFGILVGFYIGTMFGGEVLRDFPAPWSFIACAGIYVVASFSAYASGRYLLSTLAHFIP